MSLNRIANKAPSSIGQTPKSAAGDVGKTAKAGGADSLLDSKATKSPRGDVSDSAKVDVSSRAQDMMRAKELATPSDSIDEAKVARLQKMIDDGNYKVDAGAIADRMLDEHAKMPL